MKDALLTFIVLICFFLLPILPPLTFIVACMVASGAIGP